MGQKTECIAVKTYGWLSAKMHVPEDTGTYLIAMNNGEIKAFWYEACAGWMGTELDRSGIAYWMPLPAGAYDRQ